METFNKNCKLCCKMINDEHFRLIDDVIKDIFDTLLLKMTFNGEVQHLMCSTCSENLFAAYNFKWMCLCNNNTFTPHSKEFSAVDVKQEGNNILDDKQICHLCMQLTDSEYLPVHDIEIDIVQVYIPEINFKATDGAVICKRCYDSLFTHSSFIKNCLNVEQTGYEHKSSIIDTQLCGFHIKTEEIEIKQEEENEENHGKSNETQFIVVQVKEEITQESVPPLHFFGNETEIDNIERCNSEHFQQMSKLIYGGRNENKLDANKNYTHEIGSETQHKNSSEVPMQCDKSCNMSVPPLHFFGNGTKVGIIEQCNSEHLQTIPKLIYYKERNEINLDTKTRMYKCSECKYEAKFKKYLIRHQLRHKDPSEVERHKCSECEYETIYKESFKTHQLKHKDPSEVKLYECNKCKYETKYKALLIRHQLKHKDYSEVQMYKCNECEYETKYKHYLVVHQLRHRDISEVQMYRCNECSYETRNKQYCKMHELIHKDPSELKMYKCSKCKFETKYKRYLKSHQVRHKDP